ncbi:hypothetical protein [Streptomyces flaveolus]|uniref:hypothetical protein n=1 Tax=Streptomyces flaveolus TaxID=67297 RepID=UPI0033C0F630
MGQEGHITLGKGGCYLIADVDALAAEAGGEQYITAQAAADVLEIRYPAEPIEPSCVVPAACGRTSSGRSSSAAASTR